MSSERDKAPPSPKRIDALGPTQRASVLPPAILSDVEDEELQALVQRAAERMGTPIALVSLVLDRIQFFRAHYGLPSDLAASRATDRDASFCQMVVKNEQPFEVNHASQDARVPQQLVDDYGIEAYLGTPVRVNDRVVGSFCVIDVEQREFSAEQAQELDELGRQVSARLSTIAGPPQATLLDRATRPAFAELRNIITPIGANVAVASMAASELGPLVRLVEKLRQSPSSEAENDLSTNLALLSSGLEAYELLRESLDDLDGLFDRLHRVTAALSSVSLGGDTETDAGALFDLASTLAKPSMGATRLSWPVAVRGCVLSTKLADAAIVLSALINGLAESWEREPPEDLVVEGRVEDANLLLRFPAAAASDDRFESLTELIESTKLTLKRDPDAWILALPVRE